MFVLFELFETLEIKATAINKIDSRIEQLQEKYIVKLVDDLGLRVHFYKLIEI